MQQEEARSEVAQILAQIQAEYESAVIGLSGLASGTASHEFITARMERMGQLHKKLFHLVGENDAIALVADTLKNCPDRSSHPSQLV
ncbi:MAG TPA: hypothetical protein VKV19_18905 [Ktedonobacteraceae bacterium]|jgi:hypothetical protein|nr:hypothetical protein [Ktedonobacteraceae bacterium]